MKFVPDYYFERFDLASAEFLSSIGIKGILLDVDNTLEPYENPLPTEKVLTWFDSLKAAGIKAAIVSNNGKERIELFNKEIGIPYYYKAKKPFKSRLLSAMKDIGTEPENTAFMGDQIFTDVWAARNAKLKAAILVPPIKDKTDLFTKFKRLLEKPVMKKYRRRKNKEIKKNER
jgi:HAD superfamily phosphatase (TIGR01668 family)